MIKATAIALAALACLASPVLADEVEDTIRQALEAYGQNNLSQAKQSLDYASQLIAQQNAAKLSALLPAPLDGWEGADATTEAAGMAMFGGGVQAQRQYTKGEDTITVTIIADSPLMAQMMPMLTNPQMAAMMGKVTKVKGQIGLQEQSGKLTTVIANRFMLTVEGGSSDADRMAFAEAVNFEGLAGL
ncbi:hypothetical protein [Zavarzinia sp. CC-PAN008]|uniref:hypothetical protein n=1 Tax=Zavarzinia sp. CC-PAN008 TaxID=3243332 RepID=UPI003F748E14